MRGRRGRRRRADQLEQLRFLHEVARLATTARTWDELLETVVDGTRDALHADVSSLYLLDRDGAYLTLAATNGLDRFQIGRARVPFGEGVTGHVAANRRRRSSPTSRPTRASCGSAASTSAGSSPRCCQRAADLARPGRRRAQRPDRAAARCSARTTSPSSGAVADLLAGIVEKGRQQSEAEARVEALKAIDEARSELIALVTHELRTPLAVVRAYADLLADEPPLAGRESRDIERRQTRAGLAPRDARADRAARPAGRLDPGVGPGRARGRRPRSRPVDVERPRRRGPRLAAAAARPPPRRDRAARPRCTPWPTRRGCARSSSTSSRTRSSTRRPRPTITIDWALDEGIVQLGVSDEGPGIPDEWRERIFEPYARRDTHTARGSGIGLYAAKRLGESMGARLWCEPARRTARASSSPCRPRSPI